MSTILLFGKQAGIMAVAMQQLAAYQTTSVSDVADIEEHIPQASLLVIGGAVPDDERAAAKALADQHTTPVYEAEGQHGIAEGVAAALAQTQ